MFSVTYVSTATKPCPDTVLAELLLESRSWNHDHGLTGLLLYRDGHFMQMLEGTKTDVLEILAKIQNDPRHHSMMIIAQQERPTREFGDWYMGFQRLDDSSASLPPIYSDLWDLPFDSDEFLTSPTRCLELLTTFKSEFLRARGQQAPGANSGLRTEELAKAS